MDNANVGRVLNYMCNTQARVLHIFYCTKGHSVTLGVKTMKKMVKQVLRKSSLHEKLRLYGILGGETLQGITYRDAAMQAIDGGMTCMQVREKHLDKEQILKVISEINLLSFLFKSSSTRQQHITEFLAFFVYLCQKFFITINLCDYFLWSAR